MMAEADLKQMEKVENLLNKKKALRKRIILVLDKREEKSLIVSQVKLVLESPYNNMVDQIKASRRSK